MSNFYGIRHLLNEFLNVEKFSDTASIKRFADNTKEHLWGAVNRYICNSCTQRNENEEKRKGRT